MAKTGWYLDKMPEKIMAMAEFHGTLLSEISKNPTIVAKIKDSGAKIVAKYFEAYVDHLARANTQAYHHIYEFGMVGNKGARLFKASIKDGNISYSFLNSSVPNKNGQIFGKKAFIMEEGTPLDIFPTQGESLVYDLNGETIFSKHSYVANPGGEKVKGSFQSAFTSFFNSNLPERALQEFGFYEAIKSGIVSGTNSVTASVKAGNISSAKSQAKTVAKKIASEVESIGDRL